MNLQRDLSVLLGAIVIWLGCVETFGRAIEAAADHNWLLCAFRALAGLGGLSIGWRVWMSA